LCRGLGNELMDRGFTDQAVGTALLKNFRRRGLSSWVLDTQEKDSVDDSSIQSASSLRSTYEGHTMKNFTYVLAKDNRVTSWIDPHTHS
jgi:hypothetical protein